MNTAILIPFHSFVDLITNSSSETFISATEASVKTAKNLINEMLKAMGKTETADDLFNIGLTYWVQQWEKTDDDGNEFKTEAARRKFCDEQDIDIHYCKNWSALKVTAKNGKDADLKHVARLLQNFGLTFEAREFSSG